MSNTRNDKDPTISYTQPEVDRFATVGETIRQKVAHALSSDKDKDKLSQTKSYKPTTEDIINSSREATNSNYK
ncbi:hypothetical protein ABK040_008433 [Willaertia magna]